MGVDLTNLDAEGGRITEKMKRYELDRRVWARGGGLRYIYCI